MFVLMLAYLALTIIRPADYLPGLADVPLMPATLIGAFVLWLASRNKRLDAPQYVLLLAFLLALMVSVAATGWIGGAILQLQHFGPTVVAFVVLAACVDSPRRLTATMAVFVLCATVLALHGLDQIMHGVGWTGMSLSTGRRIRYVGIFNDPNDLGLLFVCAVPMAVYLFGRGGGMGLWRLLWLSCTALLVYGIYLTNSRGAMLALLVLVGVWVWRRRGLVTAAVLGSVCLSGMLMLPSRLQDVSVDESSAFGRVDAWYVGLHLFTSHPLVGVGANNFTEYNPLTAHNSFVLVLAETGFVGYVLWLAFIGYCLWMMWTVVRHRPLARADAANAGEEADAVAAEPGAARTPLATPGSANVAAAAALPSATRMAPVQAASAGAGASARGGDPEWQRERALAMTLLLSLCGFLAAAFFLSRSYLVILYLVAALAVGEYSGARSRWPQLRRFDLGRHLLRWPLLAAASIVVLFLTVHLLMATA
ncbi:MAG TPA: O-antigen ligase family protein [Rhodanobacteraceae bacterium]|nr:O-antigen ligase family protein [Rhodanobacteraceae bacterium]